jgi:hypothetical protein
MARALPVFIGFTVDERLQEFRRIDRNGRLLFVPFASPLGADLLRAYRRQTTAQSVRRAARYP